MQIIITIGLGSAGGAFLLNEFTLRNCPQGTFLILALFALVAISLFFCSLFLQLGEINSKTELTLHIGRVPTAHQ